MLTCNDRARLRSFLLGHLADEEAEQIQQHLSECPICLGTVQTLDASDTLVEVLRHQRHEMAHPEARFVAELILTLSGMRPPVGETYPFLTLAQTGEELGRLGPYRVLGVLGWGGMGIVFRAEDEQLRRAVALKVMRPELAAHPTSRRRFLREAQTAAALEHDHVVSIYQVGEDHGVPFFAMPLLRGESLQGRLEREGSLPLQEVLRIGREIALGLAAAHGQGLIHRDIKPANVWLESPTGRVKILDFGLARPVADNGGLTQQGVVAGTPHYMAPEQAEGRPVDARSDLFSLGCVLYRVATGRLFSLAERPTPPRRHRPDLARPLSELILRLLAPAPADRPASARAVADALAAMERPAPTRRRLLLAAAGLATAALLPTAAVLGPWGKQRSGESEPARPEPVGLMRVLRGHQGPVSSVAFFPDGRALSGSLDGTVRVWDLEGGIQKQRFECQSEGIANVAISPDGQRLLVGGRDGTAQLWDGDTGREVFRTDRKDKVHVAFSPNGSQALFSCYSGLVVHWGLAADKELRRLAHGWKRSSAEFSPDGRLAASAGFSGWVSVYDLASGREVRTLQAHPSGTLKACFTPNGQHVITAGFEGDVRLFDPATGKEVRRFGGHTGRVMDLAVSADGGRALTGSEDKTLRLWDLETGAELRTFEGHSSYVLSVALSPDGRFAVSGSQDQTVGVWRLPP